MRWIRILLTVIFFSGAFAAPQTWAVEPDEVLEDAQLEARARNISAQLRCLVCQNENIDSSSASLAKDLRILVRERLQAGDTDKEVLAFIVARYGDFVLLKPPVQRNTLILWLAPIILLLAGMSMIVLTMRRQGTELSVRDRTSQGASSSDAPAYHEDSPEELSPEESARLKELVEDDEIA